MKLLHVIPLVAVAGAIVIPDEQVLAEIEIEDHREQKPVASDGHLLDDLKHVVDGFRDWMGEAVDVSKNQFDNILAHAIDAGNEVSERIYSNRFDINGWLEGGCQPEPPMELFTHGLPRPPPPPHHPPFDHLPFDRPPFDHPPLEHPPPPGRPPFEHPPFQGPPHGKPHHPPPHHKSNQTIYQLISNSKYTTKLAELIDDDEELVSLLNSTTTNYTLFAPTDQAFEKIPKHAPKPSKELIKKVLLYHIAPSVYPAGRVFISHTIPTLFNSSALGGVPQRLTSRAGLRGLTLNYYSRLIAADIFASNGVIHAVDRIILPPPSVRTLVELLPTEFSTLALGLGNTGLLDVLNTTTHKGSTFFAPSNFAFKKLGPKINAFLFSKFGQKYLKALLEYHIVFNETLYSDAFYNTKDGSADILEMTPIGPRGGPLPPPPPPPFKGPDGDVKKPHGPKRHVHFDLPTLLNDRPVAVDISRFGPFTSFRVNSVSHVVHQNGIAKDGVIQVVSSILIPPKHSSRGDGVWQGEKISLEEFKERLEPFVKEDGAAEWEEL